MPAVHLPRRFDTDPRVGRLLGGKYLLLESIGAGGAGTVYLASQRPVGLRCAVKVIRPASGLSCPDRLFLEARALAEIHHPNVIRLFDYGRTRDDTWLVMEYVEGGSTLRDALGMGIAPEEAHRIAVEIAHGLQIVHEHGLVHRDVKPSNVLLQSIPRHPPRVRLGDFGLAKFISDDHHSTMAAGTPRYMAPEQATRQPLGPWTDWYALGVVACELLLGRHPFWRFDPREALMRKCSPDFDPVAALDLPLGDAAAGFVRGVLARAPGQRIAGFDAILRGLDVLLAEAREGRTSPEAAVVHIPRGRPRARTDSRTVVPTGPEASAAPGLTPPLSIAGGPERGAPSARLSRDQRPAEPRRIRWPMLGALSAAAIAALVAGGWEPAPDVRARPPRAAAAIVARRPEPAMLPTLACEPTRGQPMGAVQAPVAPIASKRRARARPKTPPAPERRTPDARVVDGGGTRHAGEAPIDLATAGRSFLEVGRSDRSATPRRGAGR